MTCLHQKLKDGDLDVVEEAVSLLPKFRDQLRPGNTKKFEAELRSFLKDWRDDVCADEGKETQLLDLVRLLNQAAQTLPQDLRPFYKDEAEKCEAMLSSRQQKKKQQEAEAMLKAFESQELQRGPSSEHSHRTILHLGLFRKACPCCFTKGNSVARNQC